MRYADSRCKITKDHKTDTYIVEGQDIFSGNDVTIHIPGPALFAYRQGAYIQDAMRMLTAAEREFLMSGMYDSFPSEPEDPEFDEDY